MIANGPLSTSDRRNLRQLEHILPDLLRSEDVFWEEYRYKFLTAGCLMESHLIFSSHVIVLYLGGWAFGPWVQDETKYTRCLVCIY